MEFYVVVLIFITCMIALALLIYYCQEHRNPKYSFSGNQKDVSVIALAIGIPGFTSNNYLEKSKADKFYRVTIPTSGSKHPVSDDDFSDSDSSASAKIYFSPKTAAYSVAKRMSVKRMNPTPYPRELLAKKIIQVVNSAADKTSVNNPTITIEVCPDDDVETATKICLDNARSSSNPDLSGVKSPAERILGEKSTGVSLGCLTRVPSPSLLHVVEE